MTADEYGFDPKETYTAEDNPFWDTTDAAHPAWWRGCDYGCQRTVEIITGWLDIPLDELKESSGIHHKEMQELKERILESRAKHEF